MAAFNRLVRFQDKSGDIHYGEVETAGHCTKKSLTGLSVRVYKGSEPWDEGFVLTDEKCVIDRILSPVVNTPIFVCIGRNYVAHVQEAKALAADKYPFYFMKPPDALGNPYDNIQVHPESRNLDYEAELAVILKKDCLNLQENDDVLPYILGYTCGNDVSSRWWQKPENCGMQYCRAKSFDKFAPLGPVIVSPNIISDASNLNIQAKVNGEVRQSATTAQMIFDVPKIIRHLSQGTTLRKGTVIMTGTPSGVAAFMNPPAWLKNGDIVEIEIEKIGSIENRFLFL